jgi:hypothetical protein
MPLQLPNLDDRTYNDLVEEARSLIPTYAPQWTNHNATDPGITLVELFAYLSEMLIYRLNRVTAANVLSFLKLLNGPDWKPLGKEPQELTPAETLAAVPETILKLRKLERAVTREDFEILAVEADERVARARCLPRLNIDVDMVREKAGHVSVIILPGKPETDLPPLIEAVENYLKPKLLLTTRLHVAGPQFLEIAIKPEVVPLPDQLDFKVKESVVNAVLKLFDPLTGGEDGNGWPFGRNVFISEIYSLIDQLPEIDYVTSIKLTLPGSDTPFPVARQIKNGVGEPVGVEVKSYELVAARIKAEDVKVGSEPEEPIGDQ